MFPSAYFATRFYAARYWPKVGDEPPGVSLVDADLAYTADEGRLHFTAREAVLHFTTRDGRLHFTADDREGALKMANQIETIPSTGKRSAKFDLSPQMESGETLALGSAVISSNPAGITKDSDALNASAIDVNNRTVEASQAFLCRLVTSGASAGVYEVTLTINSNLQEGLRAKVQVIVE